MFRKLLPIEMSLAFLLIGCDLAVSPSSININNSNTNTVTNDSHDVFNFNPTSNPSAPVPNPTGGTETPLPLPTGAQAVAQTYATANTTLLANSCVATKGESGWQFLDGMIKTLNNASKDARWGYVVKSNTGMISGDVIGYRATSDNLGLWGVDVIVDYCGTSSFAWQVLGFDENAQWSATRF